MTTRTRLAAQLAAWLGALMLSVGFGGAVYGQQDDEESAAETWQEPDASDPAGDEAAIDEDEGAIGAEEDPSASAADDEPPDDAADDAATDDGPADDAADDAATDDGPDDMAVASEDVAETADTADSSAPEGDTADVPEFMTETWAPPVTLDESDDSIPTDTSLDPTGQNWIVVRDDVPGAGQVPEWAEPRAPRGDYAGKSAVPLVRARPSGAAATGRAGRPGEDTPYSVGGKPVAPESAPWQVQIYASQWQPQGGEPLWVAQHECGGALIARDWVLTAAHCVDGILANRSIGWRVRLGALDISRGEGVTYAIDRWVKHSQYDRKRKDVGKGVPLPPNMYANDIALVHIVADGQTRPPQDGRHVQPIPLYTGPVGAGAEVTAMGWGMTQKAAGSFSPVAMKVDLRVMDTVTCQQRNGYGQQKVGPTVICAALPGQRTCRGDSGGPVVLTNGTTAQLVGVVSWGRGECVGDNQPSIFTRVQSFAGWIEQAKAAGPTRATLP